MNRYRIMLGVGIITLTVVALLTAALDTAAEKPPPAAPSSLPTAPDRPIWEWIGVNACNEMHADIAYNEDTNSYLVVFDWDLNGTGDHDILGIYISADGYQNTWVFGISAGSEDDLYPAIARNPYTPFASGGSYLVVWQRHAGPGDYDIYGSIVSDTVGAPFGIATWSDDQVYPDVAYATASGRYLVVWEDHFSGWANQPDIYSASLDWLGQDLKWLPVTNNISGSQTSPAVAVNAFDYHWLVVWSDSRNIATTSNDIYGQAVEFTSGNLSLYGNSIHISDLPYYAESPDVAWGRAMPPMSAYGEFLVTWPESGDILAQRVDGEFYTLTGSPITVSNYVSNQNNPAVLFATNQEEWWIVWEDDRVYG